MSVIIRKSKCFTFSSDETLGARNKSPDGSLFNVHLDNPITIGKALSCEIALVGASIWYVQPNISEKLNNNIFKYIFNSEPFTIEIPDGLYSLENLNSLISKEFVLREQDPNLIQLTGDYSTQKVVITFLTSGTQVDFTVPNNIGSVIGFTESVLIPSTVEPDGYFVYGNEQANFNVINYFNICAPTLVNDGLSVNNTNFSIIGVVNIPPNSVGTNISYNPTTTIDIQANEMIGKTIGDLTFQLVDDKLRPCDTFGENYSFTIRITYSILLSNENIPLLPF